MSMKEDYRTNREMLDDLLTEYDVPKMYWHNMSLLNSDVVHYIGDYNDFTRTINLIHKLSPTPLTRLHSINYDE
jgi:hypothetical protein